MQRAAHVAIGCLLIGVVSCSTADRAEPWGQGAVDLLRDEAAAISSGDAYDPLRFWAGDVDIDLSAAVPGYADRLPRAHGLDRALQLLEATRLSVTVEQVYLGDTGAFTVEGWQRPGSETVGVLRDEGPAGVESLRGFLGLARRGDAFDYRRQELLDQLRPVVSAYVAAWSSADEAALASVYATDAVKAGSGDAGPWRTSIAREDGGVLTPAGDLTAGAGLYAFAPFGEPLREAVVLLDVARPDGCVVHVAQHWDLRGDRITRDARLLEASTANGCTTAAERPTRWWVHRAPPVPPESRQTGTRVLPGGETVALFNATPDLERLLDWGLGQFAKAGLTPPRPVAVVFAPARDCAAKAGGVVAVPTGYRVTVCYTDATACASAGCPSFTEGARLFLLHELGHVWLLQNLDAAGQAAFVARAGLPGWVGADIPYAERGAEHGAETIAWGLLGEVHDRYRNLTKPPCATVAELFVLLTGKDPLSSCPSRPATGQRRPEGAY